MRSSSSAQRQTELSDVFYLILRRMRFPLLLVIGVYTFCTAGLALIPGTDPLTGRPSPPLTIFDAFYVVSFTSTTIGFGEVPHPPTKTSATIIVIIFSITLPFYL